jgi:GTP-binding protein HflX
LLAAFRSTLEEIGGSRLLLHVVDASNSRWEQQIASVNRILAELDFDKIPRLLVFNKIDLVDVESLRAMKRLAGGDDAFGSAAISALQPQTLLPMLEQIGRVLSQNLTSSFGIELPAPASGLSGHDQFIHPDE